MKFDFNDKVVGHVDGFAMTHGVVVYIDPESEWPYMVKDAETGRYDVFKEDELVSGWLEEKKEE